MCLWIHRRRKRSKQFFFHCIIWLSIFDTVLHELLQVLVVLSRGALDLTSLHGFPMLSPFSGKSTKQVFRCEMGHSLPSIHSLHSVRITESSRLEKTSKMIEFNFQLNTTISTKPQHNRMDFMSKVEIGSCLGHSNHEAIEFKIPVDRRKSDSKIYTMDLRRIDFRMIRELVSKVT